MNTRLILQKHATFLFLAVICLFSLNSEKNHAFAQGQELDQLFELLADEDLQDWEKVEAKIWKEWSKSGSDAMDFLLERGRDAMEEGNLDEAIGHFSALIDHAPDFAEGWNARATAFFLQDEFGLSIFDIQQTLRLNPRHFGAMGGLGMILERIGEKEKALDVLRRSYDLHPNQENVKEAIDRLEKETEGTAL